MYHKNIENPAKNRFVVGQKCPTKQQIVGFPAALEREPGLTRNRRNSSRKAGFLGQINTISTGFDLHESFTI